VPFLHFSGWDWRQPAMISRHFTVPADDSQSVWQHLAKQFLKALVVAGIEETSNWPYSFAKAQNGTRLTRGMRRLYWEQLKNKSPDQIIPSLFINPDAFEPPSPPALSLREAMRVFLRATKHCLWS
jgi:hypothetical protein